MPQRVPIEHKAWLLASLIAGMSFWLAKDTALAMPLKMAWKGTGVALLAGYAAVSSRSSAARVIALVMALGALGDVLIEWRLEAGGAAFLAGHLCAMALYFRNWRPRISFSQRLLASLVVPASMFIAGLCAPPGQRLPVMIYAFFVGGMAASAWTSRFPRYRTGIGAMMFLASDLLIFARMGPMATSALPGLLVWPLYFVGQFLICIGVVGAPRERAI